MASNPPGCCEVKEIFGAAGVSVEIGADGPALLWDKFIGLVSNSSLCALLRSPMGVVQQDDDCWALYSAVFNEVVAVGRAVRHFHTPAEGGGAACARADVAADGDAVDGSRSDRGQSPGVPVAGWAGQGAWTGTRHPYAGQ